MIALLFIIIIETDKNEEDPWIMKKKKNRKLITVQHNDINICLRRTKTYSLHHAVYCRHHFLIDFSNLRQLNRKRFHKNLKKKKNIYKNMRMEPQSYVMR